MHFSYTSRYLTVPNFALMIPRRLGPTNPVPALILDAGGKYAAQANVQGNANAVDMQNH